jgi:hypothetical protein
MATLYRTMRKDEDGSPLVAPSTSLLSPARGLGVRVIVDIPLDEEGFVDRDTDGMSVAHDSPEHLPDHRRPVSLGGESIDPLWKIEEEEIGDTLNYRLDEPPPGHGLIEPAWRMRLEDYELALAETREAWTECPEPLG